jgi:aryl-alcohol dehydrogenase-like predicted oxidoreductase
MIYMPLAGGLLTGKVASMDGSRTAQVEQEYGISLGPENTQFADYSALCKDIGETETAVAIAWTLHHPAVDTAIVGIRTPQQLDGLDRAAELQLSAETLEALDEIFDINKGRKIMKGESPEAHAW